MSAAFAEIPSFVLNVSQDIQELILTGRLDLASLDGRSAASLARETFVSRARTRGALDQCEALRPPRGLETFQEVLAFVITWVDAAMQVTNNELNWSAARQGCFREVLTTLQSARRLSKSELHHLDDLIARRSREYGPSLRDAYIALGYHLRPALGADSGFVALVANAYLIGASVELFNRMKSP